MSLKQDSPKAPNDRKIVPPILNTNVSLLKMGVLAVAVSMIGYLISSGRQPAQETYALCTPNAKGIYTVDSDNSLVECILIHEGYIVDSGDLGDVPFSDT